MTTIEKIRQLYNENPESKEEFSSHGYRMRLDSVFQSLEKDPPAEN